jgi:hypothetical protein
LVGREGVVILSQLFFFFEEQARDITTATMSIAGLFVWGLVQALVEMDVEVHIWVY